MADAKPSTCGSDLLFVCLGNICRSPSAEGVMAHLVAEAGLADQISVDSAGTAGWHTGERADPRSREAASRRGIELTSCGRRFEVADFERFDLILAMDRQNLAEILSLAPDEGAAERVRLLREYDRKSVVAGEMDIPDPYYGDGDSFEDVLDILERACHGLLEEVAAGSSSSADWAGR